MRIVVAGAAGFIGAAVTGRLLADGHEVVGVDCFLPDLYPAQTKRDRVADLVHHAAFRMEEIDLRHESLAHLLPDADVLVNEAAMPGLIASWDSFRTYQDCNTLLIQRLLHDLAEHPHVHLVHASTSSVYGADIDGDEDHQLAPVSPYGVTKLAAEHLVRAYRRNLGVSATILRYFSVYGPGQRPDMAYSIICDRLIEGRPVPITGDGSQRRSNTYIDDVAAATVAAALHRPDGAVLNISGSQEIGLLDAVTILADALDRRPELEFVPARRGDQRRTRGTTERAKQVLGWEPTTDIEAGLRAQAGQAAAGAETALRR